MTLKLVYIMQGVFFILAFLQFPTESYKIKNSEDVLSYLEHFGYMEEETEFMEDTVVDQEVHEALANFQDVSHIAPVGEITSKTIHVMNAPRCGNRDQRLWEGDEIAEERTELSVTDSRRSREKRAVRHRNKWQKRLLTYRIDQFPTASPAKLNVRAVQNEFDSAFKYWEDVSGLRFKKSKQGKTPDITIKFVRGSHGDEESFDGPGRTLAHGFYPKKGVVHFDDQERWSIGYKKWHFDLRTVAVHEIGHVLGLFHSNVTNAIMYYQYRGHIGHHDFQLHPNDVQAVQAIYGPKGNSGGTATMLQNIKSYLAENNRPNGTAKPNLCLDPSIDAISTMADGFTYIFKGDYYFRVQNMPWKIHKKYPELIASTFPGLPSSLDAVLTMENNRTYFFKGHLYWRSLATKMDPGYPKSIQVHFPSIPNNLDAACIWSWNNEPYFFKGREYWKYNDNRKLMKKYPHPIGKYWPGIPNSIDAAFRAPNDRTYFFKGPKYWMFHDSNSELEAASYPQYTTDFWLHCPTNDASKKIRKTRNRRRHRHHHGLN